MASLDDFNSTFTPGLDDFVSNKDSVAPVVSGSSVNNLATHVAAMSADPSQAIDKYRQVSSELTMEGKSQASDELVEYARQQQFQKSQATLVDVMTDPSIPDDVKKKAAMDVYDKNSALYNTRNILSQQALESDAGHESVEQEVVRVSLADSMHAINDYKLKQQQILNQASAEKNPDATKAFSDIFDMFVPFVEQKYVATIQKDLGASTPGAYGTALTLLGSSKKSIRDMLVGLPIDQRMEMTDKIVAAVNANSAIVSPDSNEYAKVQYLQTVLQDGAYDSVDEWVDNAVSVLDLTVLGGIAGRLVGKAARIGGLSESAIRDTVRQSARSQVQPTTVSQNYKDTNPAKAAASHEMAAADETGEAAEALYGTSRVDSVGNDIAPEISNVEGGVRNKVGNPERIHEQEITPNADVMDFVENRGDIFYDKTEKVTTRAAVVNDFYSAHGLVPRKEMFNIEHLDDGVGIKAIYGPPQGGFSTAKDAIDMAQWAMRDYGIPEEAVTLLRREGTNYVPVPKEEMATLTQGQVVSSRRVELQGQEPSLVTTTKPAPKVAPDNGVLPSASWPDVSQGPTAKRLAQTAKQPGRPYTLKDGTKVEAKIMDVDGDGENFIVQLSSNGRNVGSIQAGKTPGENPDIAVEKAFQRKGAGTLLYDLATENGLWIGEKNSKQALRTDDGQAIRKVYQPGQSKAYRAPQQQVDEVITQTDIGSTVVVKRKSDYLIQVDHKYQFSPADVTEWAKFDVNYNIFDRIFSSYNGPSLSSLGAGSLQRHVIDAASMFRPEVTKGAANAVDRAANLEKKLIEIGDDFAQVMKKIPTDRQAAVETIIREANERGLDLNYTKMVADGFRPQEIDALKSWRNYWDTVYHLENADLAKTLRNRGFKEFIDAEHDTRLFAKPIARNQAGSSAKVYDHTTGEIKHLSKQEIAELYAREGELAQLRQPMQVGDDAAELVINTNKPGKNYMRGINNSTEVLAYRKGYYSVNYTDPHFIIKKVKNSKGEVMYEKAVATAKNKKQADILTARMYATDGGEYYNRLDLKAANTSSDDYWDIAQAKGRSAQRTRGQRLEDATSSIDPSQANIMSPVDALVHSARSIGRRVEMRDMIDAGKQRALNQYSEFFPDGKYGQKVYPGNVADIQYRGGGAKDAKKLADARSTFEYFKYLEDGYINHIDDVYKSSLKFLAEAAGNKHLSKAEAAARWMGDARGPSAMGKSLAFNLYLALNPFRQFVVQSHQAVQLFAINPTWFLRGRAVPQITLIAAKELGIDISSSLLKGSGWTKEMAEKVFKDFSDTGLVASIDKQNLVRGSLINLADQTAMSRTKSALTAPITWSRKVGFDSGEYVNTLSSYLSFYDQAFRKGADMNSQEVLQNVSAASRNFTYNMNAAGDLPYNQNALSTVFQFMQVPHKAMLTMTTNRNLTAQQKIRLAAFNSIMYTLPPAAMYNVFGDALPDDPGLRDVVVQGLEGAVFNKLLSLSTGEDTNIDFSGLAPLDMFGTYEFIHSLFSTDVGTIVSSTPSGQLFFGNNPRLTNFVKTAAKYFNLTDDYDNPTSFSEVAQEFAKLSSGYSNAFKAAYAMKYQQKINTMGGTTDPQVSTAEALAQVFGFPTMDEAMRFYVNDKSYKASKAYEDDVKKWYGDYKKHLVRQGIQPAEASGITRVYTEAWRHWGNDDFRAKEIINQLLRQDVLNGDARMYQSVVRMTGMQDAGETKATIKAMPNMSEEKRKQLMDSVDFINSYKDPEGE